MKSIGRNSVEGKFHEVKGTVKAGVGRLTDDPRLEAEGTLEKIGGKIQRKSGQIKKVLAK